MITSTASRGMGEGALPHAWTRGLSPLSNRVALKKIQHFLVEAAALLDMEGVGAAFCLAQPGIGYKARYLLGIFRRQKPVLRAGHHQRRRCNPVQSIECFIALNSLYLTKMAFNSNSLHIYFGYGCKQHPAEPLIER